MAHPAAVDEGAALEAGGKIGWTRQASSSDDLHEWTDRWRSRGETSGPVSRNISGALR